MVSVPWFCFSPGTGVAIWRNRRCDEWWSCTMVAGVRHSSQDDFLELNERVESSRVWRVVFGFFQYALQDLKCVP
jgi:hypothetical protein